jgi:hypothetical protein
MITDRENTFSRYQADIRAVQAWVSTDSVDLGLLGTPQGAPAALVKDYAAGKEVPVEISVGTAFTSGGSATLVAELIMSANADLSSPTVLWTSAAIPVASLVAGYKFNIDKLPKGVTARYLGARYTVAVAAMTAGTMWGGIPLATQSNS